MHMPIFCAIFYQATISIRTTVHWMAFGFWSSKVQRFWRELANYSHFDLLMMCRECPSIEDFWNNEARSLKSKLRFPMPTATIQRATITTVFLPPIQKKRPLLRWDLAIGLILDISVSLFVLINLQFCFVNCWKKW